VQIVKAKNIEMFVVENHIQARRFSFWPGNLITEQLFLIHSKKRRADKPIRYYVI